MLRSRPIELMQSKNKDLENKKKKLRWEEDLRW
jgi:hypothetical protein